MKTTLTSALSLYVISSIVAGLSTSVGVTESTTLSFEENNPSPSLETSLIAPSGANFIAKVVKDVASQIPSSSGLDPSSVLETSTLTTQTTTSSYQPPASTSSSAQDDDTSIIYAFVTYTENSNTRSIQIPFPVVNTTSSVSSTVSSTIQSTYVSSASSTIETISSTSSSFIQSASIIVSSSMSSISAIEVATNPISTSISISTIVPITTYMKHNVTSIGSGSVAVLTSESTADAGSIYHNSFILGLFSVFFGLLI